MISKQKSNSIEQIKIVRLYNVILYVCVALLRRFFVILAPWYKWLYPLTYLLILYIADCMDERCTSTERCAKSSKYLENRYRCWLEFEYCRYRCFIQDRHGQSTIDMWKTFHLCAEYVEWYGRTAVINKSISIYFYLFHWQTIQHSNRQEQWNRRKQTNSSYNRPTKQKNKIRDGY